MHSVPAFYGVRYLTWCHRRVTVKAAGNCRKNRPFKRNTHIVFNWNLSQTVFFNKKHDTTLNCLMQTCSKSLQLSGSKGLWQHCTSVATCTNKVSNFQLLSRNFRSAVWCTGSGNRVAAENLVAAFASFVLVTWEKSQQYYIYQYKKSFAYTHLEILRGSSRSKV